MTKAVYDVANNGIVDGAEALVTVAFNDTGGAVPVNAVVYIDSADAGGRRFKLSSNDDPTTIPTIGLTLAATNNGESCQIAISGVFATSNIAGASVGDNLYLSTGGAMTTVLPAASSTVTIVFVAHLVGRVAAVDFVELINLQGLPALAIGYDPSGTTLTDENVQDAITALDLKAKAAVLGSLLKTGAGVVALGAASGEITTPTALSAFVQGVSEPANGRIAVDADSNMVVTVAYSAEHALINMISFFTIHVNGGAITDATNRNSSPVNSSGLPSDCSGSITTSLQLNAGDYISIFHTGDAIDLFTLQISLHGEEQ
jgi:hypothetical protein